MSGESLTALSEALRRRLVARFPEWQTRTELAEGADGIAGKRSLYVQVPSPAGGESYLSILERGDCIEVSFGDGRPPGGAERQITCDDGQEDSCVEAAMEFIERIVNEKVVIGRERSSWLTGRKPRPPAFMNPTEIEVRSGRLVSVRSWKGKYNWERLDPK